MGNWDDTGAALRYHEATKHSFTSVRAGGRGLDWENRPHPFKEYAEVEPEPVPPALEPLLRLGAGVVRTRELPGGDVYHFRAYASAGALYPVEVYVATSEGLFHFHPLEVALRRLRAGDPRPVLARVATAPELAQAGAVLVLTGILWRTAWKYGARGYRHLFWDAGTMLANLLALAAGKGPRLLTGFVDAEVNRLVGADGAREAALALLAVGRAREQEEEGESGDPRSPLAEATPLSRTERSYPEAPALHTSSALADPSEVARYRGDGGAAAPAGGAEADLTAGEPLARVIRRRGSARAFSADAVPAGDLAAILAAAAAPIPADVPPAAETFVVANAVAGLESGVYRFAPPDRFERRRLGSFRGAAGYLALEQEHAARAAATHFLLADLPAVVAARGNRGYRAVQLEAGIRAGRMYLGAYARRLGATGLTFYDDDTSRFLTGGTTLQPLLCVALGPEDRP